MQNNILQNIINEKFDVAKQNIREKLNEITLIKLESLRKTLGERFAQKLDERNIIHQGRTTLIRRRIRGGKLQRNIRKSKVRGYTYRGGKLQRITAIQKMKMRRAARRGAIKRRAHMQTAIRKRRRSLMRRKTMGIR